jgi:hypothetical protein
LIKRTQYKRINLNDPWKFQFNLWLLNMLLEINLGHNLQNSLFNIIITSPLFNNDEISLFPFSLLTLRVLH